MKLIVLLLFVAASTALATSDDDTVENSGEDSEDYNSDDDYDEYSYEDYDEDSNAESSVNLINDTSVAAVEEFLYDAEQQCSKVTGYDAEHVDLLRKHICHFIPNVDTKKWVKCLLQQHEVIKSDDTVNLDVETIFIPGDKDSVRKAFPICSRPSGNDIYDNAWIIWKCYFNNAPGFLTPKNIPSCIGFEEQNVKNEIPSTTTSITSNLLVPVDPPPGVSTTPEPTARPTNLQVAPIFEKCLHTYEAHCSKESGFGIHDVNRVRTGGKLTDNKEASKWAKCMLQIYNVIKSDGTVNLDLKTVYIRDDTRRSVREAFPTCSKIAGRYVNDMGARQMWNCYREKSKGHLMADISL